MRADGRVERVLVGDGADRAGAIAEIVSLAKAQGVEVHRLAKAELAALFQGDVHQGVGAELRALEFVSIDALFERAGQAGEAPLIVALDGVVDPHNLGAIIRTAHALGAHGVVVPKDRSATINATVAKASAGALEHTLVCRVTNLSRAIEEMKEKNVWVAAADPDGDQDMYDARLDGPLLIVVGAEGPGIRRGVLEHCDLRVRIPMKGAVASLNASVSAALLIGEVVRQRRSRA